MSRHPGVKKTLFRLLSFACIAVTALGISACGSKDASIEQMDARAGWHAPSGPLPEDFNTETYDRIFENSFLAAATHPLSTFSIDVDTASYTNVRRFLLDEKRLPPADAVRIEELINYFRYDYPQPSGEHPVSIAADIAGCPWNSEHRLVRIGVQGKQIHPQELPPRNLVFLIDVSGSMNQPNKLPLVQQSLNLLIDQLTEQDRVAIVVYAGESGLALPSTPGTEKHKIRAAVHRLRAGGSTNGAGGIVMAYDVAQRHFIQGGLNRVILATDGDFNVGVTNQGDLVRLIEEKRQSGVFLSVLGYGCGNLKDSTMEKLADHGNGHYAYIDAIEEARRVFVEEGAALVPIAKDVKIQVEFNPKHVVAYRLIGYENRLLRDQEFNNDRKDAGDMGAGHTVTALYEIVPAGKQVNIPGVDPLKYQQPAPLSAAADSGEALTIKLRYKDPESDSSKLLSVPVVDRGRSFDEAPEDFRFAAAVAGFGMVLRDSRYKGTATYTGVQQLARSAKGRDADGYRNEFVQLVQIAQSLASTEQAAR